MRADAWPGLRGALGGGLLLLLPLPWLLETSSCSGQPETRARTGIDLLGELEPGWQVAVGLGLLAVVALPFLARGARPLPAFLLHLAGLAGAALLGWLGWFLLTFELFSERSLKPAGGAVLAALAALGLDAAARAGLAGAAWWRERRPPNV